MAKRSIFTAEELEEMRIYDEMVDSMPMTDEDYKQIDFDDALLFPEVVKKREQTKKKVARQKAAIVAAGRLEERKEKARKYAEDNKERIKARRAAYYQENKERIAAHQKAYRERKKLAKKAATED